MSFNYIVVITNLFRFYLLVIIPFVLHLSVLVPLGNSAESEAIEKAPEIRQPSTLDVIKFHELTIRLPKQLIIVQEQLNDLPANSILQSNLASIDEQLDSLEWEISQAISNPNLSLRHISSLEVRILSVQMSLQATDNQIVRNLKLLESFFRDWAQIKSDLEGQEQIIKQDDQGLIREEDIHNLKALIFDAQNLIISYVHPTTEVGRQIAQLQTRLFTATNLFEDISQEHRLVGFDQTSPTMFSKRFYIRLDDHLFGSGLENTQIFFRYQIGFLVDNILLLVISIILFCLLTLAIHFSSRTVSSAERWHKYATRPVSTAILLCGLFILFYDVFTISENIALSWGFIFLVPFILSIGRFSDVLFQKKSNSLFLRDVCLALALVFTVAFIGFPRTTLFLTMFAVCVVVLSYRVLLPLVKSSDKDEKYPEISRNVTGLFCFMIIVLGAFGYDLLALKVFNITLSIILITAVVFIAFPAITSLLEFVFQKVPIGLISKNSAIIVKQFNPIAALFLAVLWSCNLLSAIGNYPTLHSAFIAIVSASYKHNSFELSVSLLAKIFIALYLTWQITEMIKAILRDRTFSRHHIDPGFQHSILRLINYSATIVGLLLILWILGVGLGKITIIGGALSVGIGFGLQAIVNNFVSGLILLFERPLKIGDIVVVDQEWGEVKSLGLRSTVVQTFDNAEIVIPNSELITQKVTNWTLAEKRVRVRIPIGVAYGSDIEKVLEILLSSADDNPMVLYTPSPRALFLEFGESSLNFELRVWVNNIDDKLTVLSDLNKEIENEFSINSIEIPFPQRDLHLKSVDKNVVSSLAYHGCWPDRK